MASRQNLMKERNPHILLHSFLKFFEKEKISTPPPYLLAVSGGVDSVVLCELCKQAGFSFGIAHCNFGLRGADSERDEQFVTSLADNYGVRFWVKKFDTTAYAGQHRLSIQEAARALRYEWFDQLKEEHHF